MKQIDCIRTDGFLPEFTIFQQKPFTVTNLNDSPNSESNQNLPIHSKYEHYVEESIISTLYLNLFRSKFICKDNYSIILSFYDDRCFSSQYTCVWDTTNSYESHYLDLGKEDLSNITEVQWEAVENLHIEFNFSPILEAAITPTEKPSTE